MLEAAKVIGLVWVAVILTYGLIALALIVAHRVLRILKWPIQIRPPSKSN
ncbi:hypothetical protein ABIA95_004932 [Bradyrhizobium sp. LA8.1]